MDFDTFVKIAGIIFAVASIIAYIYFRENVYLTYKEQRIPDINKKEKRK